MFKTSFLANQRILIFVSRLGVPRYIAGSLKILVIFSPTPAGRAISWKARSILVDRARSRGLEPVAEPIQVSLCPGELILHPYYIPERKTARRTSSRRRKIEVDGPRDPFVCGNGLPTGEKVKEDQVE